MKIEGFPLKWKFGNSHFWIQHTWNMKVSLSYHFYQKMPSHLFSRPFFRNPTSLVVTQPIGGEVMKEIVYLIALWSSVQITDKTEELVHLWRGTPDDVISPFIFASWGRLHFLLSILLLLFPLLLLLLLLLLLPLLLLLGQLLLRLPLLKLQHHHYHHHNHHHIIIVITIIIRRLVFFRV